LRLPLGALLALALFAAVPNLYGQSGRIKQPAAKSPSATQTRPKRAATTSDDSPQQPQPSATPVGRVTPGTIVMDEAPPPPPAPKQRPAPVEDTAPGDDIGAEDVVRITSNLVTVPASVVDAQGRAVVNLQLEDFELRVDGQPRPITELSRAEVPVTLALLFDNSQSLSAAREFEKQAAVRFFRSVIRPIDRAAIYSVSTDVTLVQPLTNNIPALVRTIEHFGKPEGATRLLDAIEQAASYLRPYPGRKVIIIVSDGEDTLSDTDFDVTLRKTLAADCQVYAVQTKQIEYVMLTGQTSNANLQALAAERRMQDLTSHTGGAVYTPFQTNDLDTAFSQISADLAQQYILSYYPTDERADGRFRTISVRVATRPNLRVRARRGYYPRRPNERISYNTTTAAANVQVGDAGSFASLSSSSQPEVVSPPASNNKQPERTNELPARSSRMGPMDAGDDAPSASRAVRIMGTEQPPARREERSARPAEPQPDAMKPAPAPAPSVEKPAQPSSNSNTGSKPAPAAVAKPATPTDDAKPVNSKPIESKTTDSKPAGSKPADPKPVDSKPASGGVLNGKALHLPRPLYPPAAKSIRAAGVVTVEVTLDEEGKVMTARAVSGNPFLRQAAVDAARQARFSPTVLSGKPVQITGVITYTFSLEN
jgi:Ca-activated chloride channel family protein